MICICGSKAKKNENRKIILLLLRVIQMILDTWRCGVDKVKRELFAFF